jgi:thiol-disulfide isomerase/thioredoxin
MLSRIPPSWLWSTSSPPGVVCIHTHCLSLFHARARALSLTSTLSSHTNGMRPLTGPCRVIAPKIVQMSNHHEDVSFYKVDVDELNDIAAEHSIRAMPTFLFFKGGEKVGEVVGANPKAIEVFPPRVAPQVGLPQYVFANGNLQAAIEKYNV